MGRLPCKVHHRREKENTAVYYVDMSVLLENIPLIKFIKTTSRTLSGLFSVISHVSLSMT